MGQTTLIDFFPFGVPPSLPFWLYTMAPQVNTGIGPCQCILQAKEWAKQGFDRPLQECMTECRAMRQTRPCFPIIDHVYQWNASLPTEGAVRGGVDSQMVSLMTRVAATFLPAVYRTMAGGSTHGMMMGENIDWILLFLSRPLTLSPPKKKGPSQNMDAAGRRTCDLAISVVNGVLRGDVVHILEVRYLNLIIAAIVRTVVRRLLRVLLESSDDGPTEGLSDFSSHTLDGAEWTLGRIYWHLWLNYAGSKRLRDHLQAVGAQMKDVRVDHPDEDANEDDDDSGRYNSTLSISYNSTCLATVGRCTEQGDELLTRPGHTIATFKDSERVISISSASATQKPPDSMHIGANIADGKFTLHAAWAIGQTQNTQNKQTTHYEAQYGPERLLSDLFAPARTYRFKKWYTKRYAAMQAPHAAPSRPPTPGGESEEAGLFRHVSQTGGCYHLQYKPLKLARQLVLLYTLTAVPHTLYLLATCTSTKVSAETGHITALCPFVCQNISIIFTGCVLCATDGPL